MKLRIVYEDNHLLVVDKPAGMLVQGDATGDATLLDEARAYRKTNENKPGNVYLGLVHRLDRPVSGLVALAKTSKAAGRLSEQWRERSVQKIYLAVVRGKRSGLPPKAGVLWREVLKRPGPSIRASSGTPTTKRPTQRAGTHCRLKQQHESWSLIELQPVTGRKHQLRQQCAGHGCPIIGDRRYGSKEDFSEGIALHAAALAFSHPTTQERIRLTCPVPRSWRRFRFASKDLQVRWDEDWPQDP